MTMNTKEFTKLPMWISLNWHLWNHFLQPVQVLNFRTCQKKNWILNFKQVER